MAHARTTQQASSTPIYGLGALLLGLVALYFLFDGDAAGVRDRVSPFGARGENRIVYFETEPVGAALAGEGGYTALTFRIGVQGAKRADAVAARLAQIQGAMLRDFTREPIHAEPDTGKLDLIGIETRTRSLLDALLGEGTVAEVRVIEARRRPI